MVLAAFVYVWENSVFQWRFPHSCQLAWARISGLCLRRKGKGRKRKSFFFESPPLSMHALITGGRGACVYTYMYIRRGKTTISFRACISRIAFGQIPPFKRRPREGGSGTLGIPAWVPFLLTPLFPSCSTIGIPPS